MFLKLIGLVLGAAAVLVAGGFFINWIGRPDLIQPFVYVVIGLMLLIEAYFVIVPRVKILKEFWNEVWEVVFPESGERRRK